MPKDGSRSPHPASYRKNGKHGGDGDTNNRSAVDASNVHISSPRSPRRDGHSSSSARASAVRSSGFDTRDERSTASDNASTAALDMSSLLADLRDQQIALNQESLQSSLAQTSALLRKFDEGINQKFSKIHIEVDHLKKKTDDHDARFAAHDKETEALRQGLALADKKEVTRADIDPFVWDRDPDLTIIKISTKCQGALDAVKVAVRDWIPDVEHSVSGQNLGKFFTVQLAGASITAARRAQKALGTLRKANGEWDQLYVERPAGGQTEMYVSEDKAPAAICAEITLRKLKKALETAGITDVRTNRREHTCSQQGIPLAKIETPKKGVIAILWYVPHADTLDINRKGITVEVTAAPARADVQWTSL